MTPEKPAQTEMTPPEGKPFPWRCPECGKKEVRPATVRHTSQIKHDGRLYAVEIPRLRVPQCGACGELVFDNDADEQIARALREQLGLLSGDQIRNNREDLGLSQRVLAEHLGVAAETISRWENGRPDPNSGYGPLSPRLLLRAGCQGRAGETIRRPRVGNARRKLAGGCQATATPPPVTVSRGMLRPTGRGLRKVRQETAPLLGRT